MHKKLSLLLVFIFTSTVLGISQNSLTFEQAILLTNDQSHTIKQVKLLKKEKEQDLKASYGSFMPRVWVSGNYIVMPEDMHLDMSPIKDAIAPLYKGLGTYGTFSGVPNPAGGVLPDAYSTKIVRGKMLEGLKKIESTNWDKIIQKKQFGTVNINASLPIYTGGRLNAKRKATKLEVEDADLEGEVKRNQITTELVQRYFGLYLSEQLEEVSKEVVKTMQQHLSDAEKMKAEGMISKAEVLHAKVYNSEAERNLKKAQRMTKISNRALLTTLNDSVERNLKPTSKLFYVEKLQPIEYFEKEALLNNPSLKRIASKKKLAKIGVRVKTAGYLPTIVALGTYDIWNHDLSAYAPKWTVGVGLTWTLFDGLKRERERKSAKLKLAQVDEFEQKVEKDIKTGVEKYYQELQMAIEQIQDLETAHEFAQEYYRVKDKAFHEGMATSTDVVNANLALVKVKTERLKATYEFDVALAKLLEICGISNQFIEYQKSLTAKTESFTNN